MTGAGEPRRSGRLELTWTNKDWRLLAREDRTWDWLPPSDYRVAEVRLLHEAGTVGDPAAENLLIRGDALKALASLAEIPANAKRYLGQVKLAYLDPPFNTQQSFLHYDDALEHSVWLTLIRDRLEQIRELLAPDGSVWVHCDDSEQHRLRCLLDETFGPGAFVATVVWQRRYSRDNRPAIGSQHHFIHVYAPLGAGWKDVRNRLPQEDMNWRNPDHDPNGPWVDEPFQAQSGRATVNQFYGVRLPNGTFVGPPDGRAWSSPQYRYEQLLRENRHRFWFGLEGNRRPRIKRYRKLGEKQGLVPWTWWTHEEVGHSEEAFNEITSLVPHEPPFATVKPERLMERIVAIATNVGETVLDCFLGSGTTAAVAHKMGRQWIGVERSRETLEKFALPRLGKVVAGEDAGGVTEAVGWEGGGGFRIIDVGPSMFEEDEGQVVLAEWATNGKLAEATAVQLHYAYEPDPPLCGRKGRNCLAVIDGHVSAPVVRLLVDALDEGERLTVCGTSVDPQADEGLRALRPGSRVRKIPDSLLAEYQETHRWRPRAIEAGSEEVAAQATGDGSAAPGTSAREGEPALVEEGAS